MITSLMDVFTPKEQDRDFIANLRTFRIKYPKNIITGHLNINLIKIIFVFDWFSNSIYF